MANPYDPSSGIGPYDPYGPDIQDPNYPSPIGPGGTTPPAPSPGGAPAFTVPSKDEFNLTPVDTGGGDGGGGGGDWGAYGGPMYPTFNLPGVPKFSAPRWTAPDPREVLNDPSYQFRLNQGEQALQNSAAGRGVLRTGGTLKDILGYGQNFASQEYSNVFNRALQGFDRNYQGAKDEYAPLLAQYQNQVAAAMDRGKLGFQRAWDAYAFPLQLQNQYDVALLGGGA